MKKQPEGTTPELKAKREVAGVPTGSIHQQPLGLISLCGLLAQFPHLCIGEGGIGGIITGVIDNETDLAMAQSAISY